METSHVPFKMVMHMKAPIVLTDFAPTLDGLIFEALSQKFCHDSHESIREKMKQYLSFHDEYQVFHASAMWFGLTEDNGLVMNSYARVDVINPEKMSSTMFNQRQRAGRYTKVQLLGGPTKTRLTMSPSYCAPYTIFYGHGDPWAIKQLIEFYVIGLGYDAQNVNMGAYSDIEVLPCQEDMSLVIDGAVNRSLPLDQAGGYTGLNAQGRLLPPYYTQDLKDVLTPEKVRAGMLKNLL